MALVSSTSSLGGFAGGNALARLLVVFSGDTSGLERAVGKAQGTLKGFGANAAAIGSSMSRILTLPLLAAGGAATYLASQFTSAMARVAGLTPILETTGKSIEDISNEILEMSTRVPTAPIELANSLYYAGSAGLSAATAMQVVELSAKGAAVGMGEASDISKVLIFALNAFESQGLTAAAAMDILTVGIREGTAAPEDLALALGRLLPVAKEAGVTFAEVVGAVASLTNIGFPARVATVALRALFAELLAPTQQATQRLATLGLTADEVRDSLRFTGPIGAFKLLERAVHGDEDALRDILPQIRGFSAYVGITGDRLDETVGIMEKATHATGVFDRALAVIQETPAFKFEIGLNKLRVAAIRVGAVMFPILIKLAAVIGDVSDRISDLPMPVLKALVAFLGLAATLGPLLKLLGNMGALTGGIATGFTQLSTSFITMGLAAFVAFGSFQSLAEGSNSLFSSLTLVASGTLAVYAALRLLQAAAVAGLFGVTRLGEALISMSTGSLIAVAVGLGLLAAVIARAIGNAGRLERSVDDMAESMLSAAKSGQTLREALKSIEDESIREQLIGVARAMDLLNNATSEALPKLQAGLGRDLIDSLATLRNGLDDARGVMGNLVSPDARSDLAQYAQVLQQAVVQGTDLGAALKAAGLSSQGFSGILDSLENFPTLAGPVRDTQTLAQEYGHISQVLRDYHQAQVDTIALQVAGSAATEQYARELGVSAEFLQSHLDAVGVAAIGMTGDVKDAFELAAFGVDKQGKRIEARVAEMEIALDDAAENISGSIEGAFAGFDKADDEVKGSLESILQTFRTNAQSVIREVGNLRELAQRGVPADVLSFLAEQGPGFVQKFVDASDQQLSRLVVLYQAQLAAIDSEIIRESLHQQTKGRNMVGKFVEGILSNDSLPVQAARRIVQATVEEFSRGNISEDGLRLAIAFAQGLGVVKGLSRAEGAAALQAFIDEVQRRDLTEIGHRQAVQIANGLAAAADIPRGKARELVQKLITGVNEETYAGAPAAARLLAREFAHGLSDQSSEVTEAGTGLASDALGGVNSASAGSRVVGSYFGATFAGGIASQAEAAYSAAYGIGQAAKRGLAAGLKGSPEYFSYYAGRELVDSLQRGIDSRPMPVLPRPMISYPLGAPWQGRSGGKYGKQRFDMDLDVTIDRSRVMREVDWDWRVSGSN